MPRCGIANVDKKDAERFRVPCGQAPPFKSAKRAKMKCPSCGTELKVSDRQGVEIDYCPDCRGVWLDRGELDKVIQRSAIDERNEHDDEDYPRRSRGHEAPRRRRNSWLGEIFDFGD